MLIFLLFALIGCNHAIQSDNTNNGVTESEIRLKNLETLVYRQSLLLSEQSNRIQTLETTVAFQRSEIQELKTNLDSVHLKQTRHGETLSVLKKFLQMKSVGNDFLEEKTHAETPNYMVKIENKTNGENVPVNRYQRLLIGNPSYGRPPALYAYMSKNENNHGPHHTLKFDIVVTSTDGAYSPLTGVFTVQTSGVYVFTFNVRMGCHAYGSFELIQNADAKGSVFLETSDTCDTQHATAVVVLDTKQGDVVYVRTHSSYGGSGDIESDDKGKTTFSGWLISH